MNSTPWLQKTPLCRRPQSDRFSSKSIAHTLGETRNRLFLEATASALEHNLKYCGATARTFTITKTLNAQGTFMDYEVIDAWTSAYKRSGKGTRRYKTREAFAKDYPYLSKLLPADFR
jgi:hypothetical protein